jgi:hypothetical protein
LRSAFDCQARQEARTNGNKGIVVTFTLEAQLPQVFLVVDARRAIDAAKEITKTLISARKPGLHPMAFRRQLQCACQQAVAHSLLRSVEHLVLLFGSAARGERSRDLDLIFVVNAAMLARYYERLDEVGVKVDLNVVSPAWLDNADRDLEWGYCLTESFVLGTNSECIEESWREAVIRYSRPESRTRRILQHFSEADKLSQARLAATAKRCPLVARLLGQEAVRSVVSAVIEGYGQRVFSHRSLVSELKHASHRSGIESSIFAQLMSGLGEGVSSRGASATRKYVHIRNQISTVYRSLETRFGVPYDPGSERAQRLQQLVNISNHPALNTVERFLLTISAGQWLPSLQALELADEAARTVAVRLHALEMEASRSRRIGIGASPRPFLVPSLNEVRGARWVEIHDDRLKVILNTGGCKTPTCTFCQLPAYGRQRPRSSPKLLESLLAKHRPRRLALYNDGSILNPREIALTELKALCAAVRHHQVKSLLVESIPRFITERRIRDVLAESGVETLCVAMGFQCAGNWVADTVLGRPDADAIFDRAIDVLKSCGARVRLYLAWGFPGVRDDLWPGLLKASLRWTASRRVDLVTICPYVRPADLDARTSPYSLCRLRRTLAEVTFSGVTKLDVSLADEPSCGSSYCGAECPDCRERLRQGTWRMGPRCTYGG